MGHMTGNSRNEKLGPSYQNQLNSNCLTIAEALNQGGYRTAISGKWHVGADQTDYWPHSRGFQRSFALIQGASNFFHTQGKDIALNGTKIIPEDLPQYAGGFYITDAFTDYALDFIDEFTQDAAPFFLYLAYNAPHWPLEAKQQDIDKYLGQYKAAGGWPAIRQQRYETMKSMGIIEPAWALSDPSFGVADWNLVDQNDLDLKMATYSAMIDCVDQNIGRVIDKLKAEAVFDNTLIFFLSDNGACQEGQGPSPSWANASNTPYRRYKHHNHEGGIATPFIAHWPEGIQKKNLITDQLAHIIDIMATCLDVAKTPYPDKYNGNDIIPLEGKSLLPVFQSGTRPGHDHLCFEHEANRACRKGKWKIVSPYYDSTIFPWELYDLEADRTETIDLAGTYPEKVTELVALYNTWSTRCGAATPQKWKSTGYAGKK
jgi:arylsulfatase